MKKYYNSIVKPDTFTKLNPKITEITGITNEDIISEGKDIKVVFKEIKELFKQASCINSYNLIFDKNVLLSELYRIHDREFIRIINKGIIQWYAILTVSTINTIQINSNY